MCKKFLSGSTYNMAMHQPRTGIVRLKSNYKPSRTGKYGNITARWIDKVQQRNTAGAEGTGGHSTENRKVVAVYVDRMRYSASILDYPE